MGRSGVHDNKLAVVLWLLIEIDIAEPYQVQAVAPHWPVRAENVPQYHVPAEFRRYGSDQILALALLRQLRADQGCQRDKKAETGKRSGSIPPAALNCGSDHNEFLQDDCCINGALW